jgi:cardiolipin synthase
MRAHVRISEVRRRRHRRPAPKSRRRPFFGSYARRERAFIRKAYLLAIVGATRSIRITHAYFVPDRVLRRSLIKAARRGVNVEIIVGGATDVPPALLMARALYLALLREGVSIYEFHERVLHAKTGVIDGHWSTIGSSNFDYMSIYWNLEVNVGIQGERIGSAMEDQFAVDKSRSRRIELRSWLTRPWQPRALDALIRFSVRWY